MELFLSSEYDSRFIKFALINTLIDGCNIIEGLEIVFEVSKDEWGNEYLNICQVIKNEKSQNENIGFATFYNHYNYTQGLKELVTNKDYHKFFKIKNIFNNIPGNKVKLDINIYIDKTYLLNIYETNSIPKLIYKIIIDNSIKIKNNGGYNVLLDDHKKFASVLKNISNNGNIILQSSFKVDKNIFKISLFDHQIKNISWMIDIERKISEDILNISYYNFDHPNIAKYYIDSIREDIYLNISSREMYDIKKAPLNFLNLYGGILCDEVGLGKTLSMLGLVNKDKCKNNTSLVFTPRRLCKQWYEEIIKYTNLSCSVIYSIKQIKLLDDDKIKEYDIIIIPYSLLDNKKYKEELEKDNIFHINKYNWHRVILDESHEFINSCNYVSVLRIRDYLNSIPSKYRWLCSGTPFTKIQDIKSIMSYLLKVNISKNKKIKKYEQFKSSDNLIKTFYIWESILKSICRRNLKTKLKEIQIPLPIINTEYLYQSPIEKIIYDSALGDKKKMVELCNHILVSEQHIKILGNEPLSLKEIHNKMIKYYSNKKIKIDKRINNLNIELEKYKSRKYKSSAEKMLIENFISSLEEKIDINNKDLLNIQSKYKIFNSLSETLDDNKKCPICLEPLKELAKVVTVCGHFFCSRCLSETLKNYNHKKCPICRETIIEEQLEVILPDNIQNNQDKWGTKMTKMIIYLNEILENSDNRVIIFSQFDNMLRLVGKVLQESNINHLFLNGSFNVINGRIRRFKLNTDIRVVLLSSEKSASGLNLTEANHIILLDTHNAESGLCSLIEEQAIGRSVRIGQKDNVIVKRFVMKDTIEEENYNKNVKVI